MTMAQRRHDFGVSARGRSESPETYYASTP
jgi:hypothetical protein